MRSLGSTTSLALLILVVTVGPGRGIGTSRFETSHESTHYSSSGGPQNKGPDYYAQASPSLRSYAGLQGPLPMVQQTQTTRGVGRSVVLSVLLLITIIVAGTYTLRKEESAAPKASTRECPLRLAFPEDSCSDPRSKISELDIWESPDDWEHSLVSPDGFQCVFDPSVIMLDMLLHLPPPSFISKAGPSDLNAIIAQFQTLRKTYVSISDGN